MEMLLARYNGLWKITGKQPETRCNGLSIGERLAQHDSILDSILQRVRAELEHLYAESGGGYHQLLGEAVEKHQHIAAMQAWIDDIGVHVANIVSEVESTVFVKAEAVDTAVLSLSARIDSIVAGSGPTGSGMAGLVTDGKMAGLISL